MIQQESPLDDGLAREWDPPNLGVDMHYGYAFQWLALAAHHTRVLSRDPCQTPRPGRSSASLWLIVALTAAPVAASYLLYYFWPPERTVNYGELIEPRPLPDPQLALADGTPFRLSQLRGKWVLVSVDSGRCDARLRQEAALHAAAAAHAGQEYGARRAGVADLGRRRAAPDVVAPYQGTWLVRAAGAGLLKRLPAPGAASDHIYLIDPLGNLMMRFPRDPEPGRMIKDLSRLLKASHIG